MADSPRHILILVPDPAYPEPWAWAFHVEADALRAAGFAVSARPWTAPGDLTPFDAVLPLVVWGYHERYEAWLALLDRLEAEAVPTINPPTLLRWNSDKTYLAELDAGGVPTVHTIAVEALDEHGLRDSRERFGCDRLVVKQPISAAAWDTFLLGPTDPVPAVLRDPKDDFLLTAATLGDADYLVTGDRDLTDIREHLERPRILTVADFLELLPPERTD